MKRLRLRALDLPARKKVSMRIPRRFKASAGQCLLEVLVVVAVFGGALAVAMPAYLGFQDRKADKQARFAQRN